MAKKASLSIHVIPQREPGYSLYYRSSRLVSFGEHIITDTGDMVRVVKALKQQHGLSVGQLTITGHGNPDGFYIGSDWVTVLTLTTPGNAVLAELSSLQGVFAADALVILRACDTGESETILKALSTALGGVSVRGSGWKQFGPIPGLTGDTVECTLLDCHRPSYPAPDFPALPPQRELL